MWVISTITRFWHLCVSMWDSRSWQKSSDQIQQILFPFRRRGLKLPSPKKLMAWQHSFMIKHSLYDQRETLSTSTEISVSWSVSRMEGLSYVVCMCVQGVFKMRDNGSTSILSHQLDHSFFSCINYFSSFTTPSIPSFSLTLPQMLCVAPWTYPP